MQTEAKIHNSVQIRHPTSKFTQFSPVAPHTSLLLVLWESSKILPIWMNKYCSTKNNECCSTENLTEISKPGITQLFGISQAYFWCWDFSSASSLLHMYIVLFKGFPFSPDATTQPFKWHTSCIKLSGDQQCFISVCSSQLFFWHSINTPWQPLLGLWLFSQWEGKTPQNCRYKVDRFLWFYIF